MKNRRLVGISVIICIILFSLLHSFVPTKEIMAGQTKQGVVILTDENAKDYESCFGQNIFKYVNEDDSQISVKDITDSDLNNAYLNDKLVAEQYYSYSGMVPVQKEEELPFGASYRIPTILLRADSNVLFSNTDESYWETEENCLKVTFFFDVIRKSDLKETDEEDLEIGLWKNESFISYGNINKANYYGESAHVFQGDNFYPRIRYIGTEDIIIANGIITIVRDDTMKKIS